MRRRTRRIRRSIAALAVVLFTVAFAVIYVQLASGRDPALVAAARRRTELAHRRADTSKTTTSTSAESTGSTDEPTGSGESSGSSSGEESSSPVRGQAGATAVTTSQS